MNQLEKVSNIITESAGQFISTVAQYKWELIPDSQLHAAKQALTKSDYIMKVAASNPEAVHDSLMKSAILGLDLTEGKRQGWLLPRKNQQGNTVIQLQVGYKGVEAIHQRMGVIDRLSIRVVRENDQFDWSGDDQEKPSHKADWFATDEQRGKIIGAFAITYYPDGSINVTSAPISEIYEKHRDIADSWKSYQNKLAKGETPFPPPWVSHEKAMIEKTMAYIASKQWPANIRNQEASSKILETLHEVDTEDYSEFRNRYTAEQKEVFYNMVESENGFGLFLYSQHVELDTWIGLFNSAPKGEKVKLKDKVRALEKVGAETFSEAMDSIKTEDIWKFAECFEDIDPITIGMFKRRLDEHQRRVFDEMREQMKAAYEAPSLEE